MTTTDLINDRISSHLPVVGYEVNSVMRRLPRHIAREDLVSAGNLGLVQAAQNYDPDSGVTFHRWAAVRIRGALLDELRSVDWLSRGARKRAKTVGQVADSLASTLGRVPTIEEVAAATGLSIEEVADGRADANTRIASLDEMPDPVQESIVDTTLLPEESLLSQERAVYLHAAVTMLPDRLRTVIEGVFFLDRTVADLAEEIGVTVSRISQMKSDALSLMRDAMNASLDPDLVEHSTGLVERRRQAFYARVAAQAAQAATVALVRTPTRAGDQEHGVRAVA